MKKNCFIIIFLTAGILQSALAQAPNDATTIQRIRNEGLNNSKVMENAFYITDVAGPRLTNSPGLKRAQEWAVNTFKSWGLQNVNLESWGTFGRGWEVQKYYAAVTAPYYYSIIGSPKAWTPGTNGLIKSEVILLKIDSVSDLAKYKGKLKGKIVILDNPAPVETTFKADGVRYTDEQLLQLATPTQPPVTRTTSAVNPQESINRYKQLLELRSSISEFFIAERTALILSRTRGTHGTFFTSNGASYAADAKPVTPEIEVSTEDYLRLLRLVKSGTKVLLEAEIKTSFQDKDLAGYNVIAEIPGTDPILKEEVVMLGAHYDSWHSATGATDNAAGSAVMIEVMRIIKTLDLKPKRTIRIALWDGEEQGLFGSRGYAASHFGNRKTLVMNTAQGKISSYYNLDNGTGKIRGIYLQGNEGVRNIFTEWLEPFKDLGAATITSRNTGGTDHLSFDELGIPGFQFIQDGIEYGSRTHHSNQDTFDRLIAEDLKQAATIIAAFVFNTAQLDHKLPRKELPVIKTVN
ncbi:MAG TPA: M20/M25/M40 family metallo-hydrolase [Sphingobacteriaceae bacterium]|nr:M20/M25/M40 family metallo-hydrolase [Sphingobacteriaceae bacterium]